ncbi:NAD(P)-dependent oxidoreductase [Nesterenkonia sp. Act20]|uniref:NAD-dependent epimerase/dehydratase family protein n=1 Tax=Nesterenkonia sp. Act20 TaxID=1483432 RepID=UPI001C437ADD|nr:NAD(P)-dependent oxidoreductase [Nesterenkonia sp. Act20]
MNQIIVTGATGFLGEAVSEELALAGHTLVRTDRRESSGVQALDVTDAKDLDRFFALHSGVTSVVHLAAAGSGADGLVAGASGNPASAVRTNIEGFVHVVETAARHGVHRVVWASSTTVYGAAPSYTSAQVHEDAPFAPTTIYGSTKVACEHLGPVLAANLGVEVVSLRLPMVYGPGRWYGGSQEALIKIVDSARTSSPVDTRCWTTRTDWIHVQDAASALRILTEVEEPSSAYHVVGHRGSLAELARQIAATLNVAPEGIETTDVGGPDIPLTDDSRIRTRHRWTPQYPTAATGAATFKQPIQPNQ